MPLRDVDFRRSYKPSGERFLASSFLAVRGSRTTTVGVIDLWFVMSHVAIFSFPSTVSALDVMIRPGEWTVICRSSGNIPRVKRSARPLNSLLYLYFKSPLASVVDCHREASFFSFLSSIQESWSSESYPRSRIHRVFPKTTSRVMLARSFVFANDFLNSSDCQSKPRLSRSMHFMSSSFRI